ncbi:hypothetical protein AVEN_196628-1 [Araneus ventricosus]|uniref:Uncharacterized protein n=1 Tax=Araneus ventricosus TaxID=182803 RepID=A0A4Y2E5F2_ARAVE|nr:hypothetical protein AVEN_196628-1 [Araneus ventricosus]
MCPLRKRVRVVGRFCCRSIDRQPPSGEHRYQRCTGGMVVYSCLAEAAPNRWLDQIGVMFVWVISVSFIGFGMGKVKGQQGLGAWRVERFQCLLELVFAGSCCSSRAYRRS